MVSLVRFEPSLHSNKLYKLYLDKSCSEFFRRTPFNLNFSSIQDIEATTSSSFFSVIDTNIQDPIGFICLTSYDPYFSSSCQIGLVLDEEYRDKHIPNTKLKYTFLIMLEFVDKLFKETNLNKIKVRILSHRTDLEESLRKGHFIYEGTFPEEVFFQGKRCAEKQFCITRKVFNKNYGDKK